MHGVRLSRWLLALALVGCGSKLQIDHADPGSSSGGAIGSLGGDGAAASDATSAGGLSPPVGFTVPTGGGGGEGEGATLGNLGHACVNGDTVTEALQSAAQAKITSLDHCNNGLACGPHQVCGTVPDCPQQSGSCVVRHPTGMTARSGAGGETGTGGASSDAVPEPEVVALAADANQLYWLEYGSRDQLGNYQNDGALKAVSVTGGQATTLASALPGPIGLGLTTSQAYFYVDGGPLIGMPIHAQLLRMPLSGGALELVQDGASPLRFIGIGEQAFWTGTDSVFTVAGEHGSQPNVFLPSWSGELETDGTDLYSGNSVIWRASLDGSPAVSLNLDWFPFALSGDSVYAIDGLSQEGVILNQAPKAGGTWRRIRALGEGKSPNSLQIVGDRYFVDAYIDLRLSVVTASLSSATPPTRLLDWSLPRHLAPIPWVATRTTFYWTDGSTIYARALADLPE